MKSSQPPGDGTLEAQDQKSPRFEIVQSFQHLLHRAAQRADFGLEQALVEFLLTPRQIAVLDSVGRKPGISQTTLVDETGIDRSTVATVVARLVARGLVSRRKSRFDTRAYELNLSPKGARLIANALPTAERTDAVLLDVLPKPYRENMLACLQLLAASR